MIPPNPLAIPFVDDPEEAATFPWVVVASTPGRGSAYHPAKDAKQAEAFRQSLLGAPQIETITGLEAAERLRERKEREDAEPLLDS